MDGHIMRCGTIGSCQSAATSEIVKRCMVTSLTHVSGAIAIVQTFTFIFTSNVTVIDGHSVRRVSALGDWSIVRYI